MASVPFVREHASEHAAVMIARMLGLSVDTAGRVTDFNRGARARTLLEAVAVRFEHLDAKAFAALARAIPTVLYEFFGEGDGVATTVGFPALPALPASGLARFVRSGGEDDIAIPAGTRLVVEAVGTVAAKDYETTLPGTLLAGSLAVDIPVRSLVAGTGGNTPAQTLRLVDTITNVASATNPAALLNGTAAETDEGRRQRFTAYLRNLARSPDAGLEVGARTARVLAAGVVIEQALFARAIMPVEKRGLVDVYVDNGGGTASAALVAAAQAVVDGGHALDGSRVVGYKAAGIVVRVKAVIPQVVAVTLRLRVDPGQTFATVSTAVASAVSLYLFSLGVFTDLVLADLICAAASVRGVADVQVASPAANVTASLGGRILPGVVTITELA
jgi:uncharacterized phage protein gp47/JayE